MLSSVLAAYLAIALPLQADERPARPTDEQMLAQLFASRPGARLVSVNFRDTPYGGARTGCGLIELDGQIEPFNLLAAWNDERPSRVVVAGLPPSDHRAAGWRISDTAPTHADHDDDGAITRFDRNIDIMKRKSALLFCNDTNPIAQPENVTWVLESEPHPDPERAARNRGLAEQLAGAVMGAAERRAED